MAKVAQNSLLGAKFVRLAPPAPAKPRGRRSGGDVIPLSRTGRYPEVEEVLSALSLLLNGGGLQQLHTITEELGAVLDGRERRLRDQLDTFVGGLEEQKSEIVRALDGIKRLSSTLRYQKETLANAIDDIEPAIEVLNEQEDDLTKALVALSDLGDVATHVIDGSREDLLANLRKLRPILKRLADAGSSRPGASGHGHGSSTGPGAGGDSGSASRNTPSPGTPAAPTPSLPGSSGGQRGNTGGESSGSSSGDDLLDLLTGDDA